MLITDLDNNYTIVYSYVRGRGTFPLHAVYADELLSMDVDPMGTLSRWHIKDYALTYIEFGSGKPDRIIEWFYDEELVW